MQSSALQLRHYFVAEVTLSANPAFDPKQKLALKIGDLDVEHEERPVEGQPRQWQVIMKIKLAAPPDRNSPYFFSLGLNSVFDINPKTEEAMIPMLVSNSAPSVLYGIAREYLRSLMSAGPYPALLMPTLVFPPSGGKPAPATPAAGAVNSGAGDTPMSAAT
jgi:preprotein translocase subunit SecB